MNYLYFTQGDPEPDVTWFKDSKEIKVGHKGGRFRSGWDTNDDSQWLEITSAETEDGGTYMVRAENHGGQTEAEVKVICASQRDKTKIRTARKQ